MLGDNRGVAVMSCVRSTKLLHAGPHAGLVLRWVIVCGLVMVKRLGL